MSSDSEEIMGAMTAARAPATAPTGEAPEDADRQKEPATTSDPTVAVRREPSTRHDAVDVGMDIQGLAPGVKDGKAADLSTQVFGILCDLLEGLGRGSEQDAVDDLLVLERERGEFVGNAEDQMEVRHRQEFLASVLDPFSASQFLALGDARNGRISGACREAGAVSGPSGSP